MELLLFAVVAVALFFDFTNGFHDTANSIATSVSTRALSPRTAVVSAAILNFLGAFVSFEVAATIASGIVDQEAITLDIVLAGLVGAITWNLITWYLGLALELEPRADRWHGRFRGRRGGPRRRPVARAVGQGAHPVVARARDGGAPCRGTHDPRALDHPEARAGIVNRIFRRLQLVSGGFVAFTHGTNDAQKTMGIIALALVASGHLSPDFERPPLWVIVSAATAMAFGTYAGGWRIIKTLGSRIAKLEPPQGFAAQTACASILFTTAHYGFPVSTTHTISGSVLGAGASSRLSAVRWGVAGNILVAWVLTIPCAALVGAGMETLTRVPGGAVLVFLLTAAIACTAFLGRTIQARRLRVRPAEA